NGSPGEIRILVAGPRPAMFSRTPQRLNCLSPLAFRHLWSITNNKNQAWPRTSGEVEPHIRDIFWVQKFHKAQETCMVSMEKLNDWLSAIPSPQTRKSYKNGIKQFEKYLGEDIDSVTSQDDVTLGHTLEKFYVALKDSGKKQNTCRATFNGVLQYFKYQGKNPKYRKALGIFRTTMSTRNEKLTIDQVQSMAKVSDLREQILLEVLLLGLRVSDASTLEWKSFEQDEFLLNTKKESVVAHIFVSPEFREILNKYLNTLDKSNKYLFQSAKNEYLTSKHLNYMLQELGRRAGLTNNIFFHLGRKLVFRTGLELGIPNPNMKLLLGKSVPISDGTYYAENINLRPDFDKLHQTIRLFPTNGNGRVSSLQESVDLLMKVLRRMIDKEMGIKRVMEITDKEALEEYLLES
ncbi:tyrosine-type recombinase/integrase, partial [Candidatus Bathyarchaeota archaeon]|nr:tyrosine-type recombinase/integrase [Candidatus Bathyarchaeota archaeon]